MQSVKKHVKKVAIGIAGGVVLIIGIIAIPYPGPGWLIVFAGLAILASEFTWAERLLSFGREKYDMWTEWLKKQPISTRLFILGVMGIVIVVTIWLLNGFGLINNWLNLPFEWIESPLF